jgi:RimJ/RimL family protein N-acetyltransferase
VEIVMTSASTKLHMTVELYTKRLLLRPLQLCDAEQTQRLLLQWEIVKFLNSKVPWPYPADRVLNVYRNGILPGIERGEEWLWTLRLREAPDQHIGVISLHRDERDNRGYWLGLPWHGQGLMTEAVVAVNDYWLDVLGFAVLRAPKAIANIASRRISEKQVCARLRSMSAITYPASSWRRHGRSPPKNGALRDCSSKLSLF